MELRLLSYNNLRSVLPKWKKDAIEFTVGINYHETRGYQSSIPRPIIEALGKPDKITFEIHGRSIRVVGA